MLLGAIELDFRRPHCEFPTQAAIVKNWYSCEKLVPDGYDTSDNPGPPPTRRRSALTAGRALRRRYVGTGSNIKTKAGPTSKGRPVRTRQNRNVAPPDPPPRCPSSQSGAARGPTTPPRPVIGHCQGPPPCARLTPKLTVENLSIHSASAVNCCDFLCGFLQSYQSSRTHQNIVPKQIVGFPQF